MVSSWQQYQQLAEPLTVPVFTGVGGSPARTYSRRRRFQYQALAEPIYSGGTELAPQLDWCVQHPGPVRRIVPPPPTGFTEPLEPTLWTPWKLDWCVQQPGPVRRIVPQPPTQFVESFVDGLRNPPHMDWLVEHPEPVRRIVPPPPGQMFGLPDFPTQIPLLVPQLFFQPEIPVRKVTRETPWCSTQVVDPSVSAVTPTGWNLVQEEFPQSRRFAPQGGAVQVLQTIVPAALLSNWYVEPQIPVRRPVVSPAPYFTEPLEPTLRTIPLMGWLVQAPQIPVRRRPQIDGLSVEPLIVQADWPVIQRPGCPYEPPTVETIDAQDAVPEPVAGDSPPALDEGDGYQPGSIETCQ